jgi:hypothetical protein
MRGETKADVRTKGGDGEEKLTEPTRAVRRFARR